MSFSKDVSRFVDKAEKRQSAIFRTAVQDLTERANTPIAKGGRMPVDTGALRGSLVGKTGSMPDSSSDSIAAALARWKLGETFYAGWFQHYAPYMEAMYGYMRGAAEKWPQIVKDAVRKVT
jgi:hypothetical protein